MRKAILLVGRWVLGRLIRFVPEALLGRILPGSLRFAPAGSPPPPNAPNTPIRLYVGPVNWAGQGWQWARAAERNLEGVGAVSMAYLLGNEFGHPVDNPVPVGRYVASASWQRRQYAAVRDGFTHVMIEAERQPFGAILDQSVSRQVRWLLRDGIEVMMLCHGTDIRLPSRHAAMNPFSPFRESLWKLTPRLETQARENRRLLDDLGRPVLVSTPDLLLDVPYARWLPVVVDTAAWASDPRPSDCWPTTSSRPPPSIVSRHPPMSRTSPNSGPWRRQASSVRA